MDPLPLSVAGRVRRAPRSWPGTGPPLRGGISTRRTLRPQPWAHHCHRPHWTSQGTEAPEEAGACSGSPPGGVGPGPCPSLSPVPEAQFTSGEVSEGAHLSVRYLQVCLEVTYLGGLNTGGRTATREGPLPPGT